MATPTSSVQSPRKGSSIKDRVLSKTKSILHYFSPASATPKKSFVKDEDVKFQDGDQLHEKCVKDAYVKRLFEGNGPDQCDNTCNKKQRRDSNAMITDLNSEENDSKSDVSNKYQLGLVRVDCPGIKLDELTEFLCSIETKSHQETIYPLFPGAILGRGEQPSTSSNGSIHRKVNIGIPKSENGISRKQVKVESIRTNSFQKKHNTIEPKRRLNSVKSQMQYIDDIQSYAPSIKISCASDAVNPILVCKVRCNPIYLSGKEKFRGVPLRNQVDLLHMGNCVELKVGDALEFDLYNRTKVEGTTSKYLSARSSGKYVFRIVAYEPDPIHIEPNTDVECANVPSIVIDHDVEHDSNHIKTPNLAIFTEIDIPENNASHGTEKTTIAIPIIDPCDGGDSCSTTVAETKSNLEQSVIDYNELPNVSDTGSTADQNHERIVEVTPNATPKSDDQPSSADHTIRKPTVYVPQVGDLFRVGLTDKDLFTSKKCMKWYIGSATSVRLKKGHNNKYIIGFKFNDSQSCTEEYPHKCVMPLVKRTNSIYEIAHGLQSGMFALDNDPKQLILGDFVECRFQDGALNGLWWYGRIAAVHEDLKTVDVAYFDQNYEKNVPISSGNIHLIQRGTFKTAEWMLGAMIPTENGSHSMKVINVLAPEELSPEVDMSNAVKVVISTGRGQNKTERIISYVEAAKLLFSNLLQKRIHDEQRTGDHLVMNWPNNQNLPLSQTEKSKIMAYLGSVTAEETMISGIASQALMQLTNVAEFSQDSNVSLDDDIVEKSSRISLASELSPILANTCWRHLNSAEPHVGHGFLVNQLIHSNKIPNKLLAERLFDFVLNGPMVDNTKFPEPHRTSLVFDYIHRLKTKIEMEKIQFAHAIAPTDFDQLEYLLKLPLLMADKVTPSTISKSQTEECSLGLHHARHAIFFAESNIQNELKSMISDAFKFDENLLNEMHFVKILLIDARKLLQNVTDIVIQTWLRHGHWIVGFVGEGKRTCSSLYESRCSIEAYDVLKSLGRILCHVAWLFCAIERKPFPDFSCCYIIRDVVLRELERFDYNELCQNEVDDAMKIQYSKDITLRFVLSLDSSFAKSLLVRVGEVLNMHEEISIILG